MSDLLAVGSATAATGGRGAGVSLLARDPRTGRVRPVATPSPGDSPTFLAPAGRGRLHAAHEVADGRLSTRAFDGTAWSVQGEVPSGGSSPCHVAVHPSGDLLVVANYGGSVGVVAARDGVVRDLVQTLTATGGGPVADRQEGSHPHSATFLGDGSSVVVADLGADELRVHAVDRTAGRLSADPVQVVRTAPGSGPRHAVLRGDRLVVVGELDATVTSWAVAGG
ncbi:beta-propeller fold lactonase family protein, partial [Kineococcus sp. R8]|uniref:beta-propeller fold lactonase family protein n=1 Tax=Kineococcus siccus TaxID=2696567 RepID=UPI00141340C4|nr:beta-propeller fold lactonase family protein [Kineococcus siccus]